VCGGGAESEVGKKEGVVVIDGEGGEEGVWDVKRGSGEEDFEGGGGRGEKGDGVGFVKMVIMVFRLYSKAWVGPRREGRVWGKDIKRGKRRCFSNCREDRESKEGVGDPCGFLGGIGGGGNVWEG